MKDKNIIYSRLRGGLGNQLFIYAALRGMQHKYMGGEGKILMSREYAQEILLTDYNVCKELSIFEHIEIPFLTKIAKQVVGYGYRFCKSPRQMYNWANYIKKFVYPLGVIRCEDGYIPLPEKTRLPIFADGYFQSENYFRGIRDILLRELTPNKPVLEKNKAIIEMIKDTESVCLSVRLGVFVKHPVHEVCSPSYYTRAIKKMKELHPDCKFFLFSDEPELAKKLIDLPPDTVVEYGDDPAYEALRVMSHCKHFIISNSSFHWWAQYLSTNKNKTVIAPNRWYNTDLPCDIFQEYWILLSPDDENVK